MKNNVYARGIFFVTICLLAAFCILELVLRLAGFIIVRKQDFDNSDARKRQGAVRIMCIGESSTFLGGSDSYPAQLERILNAGSKKVPGFAVINKGVCGISTTAITDELGKNIARYRPDIVVAMIGVTDGALDIPYEMIVASGRSGNFFASLRSVRYIRLLAQNLTRRTRRLPGQTVWKMFEPDYASGLEADLKRGIQSEPLNAQRYLDLARFYTDTSGPASELKGLLDKAAALDPRNDKIHLELGVFYSMHDNIPAAEEAFAQAIALNPDNLTSYEALTFYSALGNKGMIDGALERMIAAGVNPFDDAFYTLEWFYASRGEPVPGADQLLEKALISYPRNDRLYAARATLAWNCGDRGKAAEYYARAEELRLSYYNRETVENFHRIKAILDTHGIGFVCVQYPMRSVEPLRRIFNGGRGVYFVDNEASFKNAVSKDGYGKYFVDMHAGDFGHCTPAGNALLAGNVAGVIRKELLKE